MKRPDRKAPTLLLAGLLAVCGAGCSGINASVPITPLMFMQKSPPKTAPQGQPVPVLALNDAPTAGQ